MSTVVFCTVTPIERLWPEDFPLTETAPIKILNTYFLIQLYTITVSLFNSMQ